MVFVLLLKLVLGRSGPLGMTCLTLVQPVLVLLFILCVQHFKGMNCISASCKHHFLLQMSSLLTFGVSCCRCASFCCALASCCSDGFEASLIKGFLPIGVWFSWASVKDSFINVEVFVGTSVFLQFISSILFKLLIVSSRCLNEWVSWLRIVCISINQWNGLLAVTLNAGTRPAGDYCYSSQVHIYQNTIRKSAYGHVLRWKGGS